ncbi:MAG TPA: nuclear transport factor 2 family protein, partial [Acidimicrobiia bacterium]|nr:nuclear transport factor 2 family protein [Acidimicrobiia bacterium]
MVSDFAAVLDAFYDSFAGGRTDEFLAFFADDARVLLHEQQAIEGIESIAASFTELFAEVDTSAFVVTPDLVDIEGDRVHVLAEFTETLLVRDGGSRISVDGRIVL